jgi:hypothetical protein
LYTYLSSGTHSRSSCTNAHTVNTRVGPMSPLTPTPSGASAGAHRPRSGGGGGGGEWHTAPCCACDARARAVDAACRMWRGRRDAAPPRWSARASRVCGRTARGSRAHRCRRSAAPQTRALQPHQRRAQRASQRTAASHRLSPRPPPTARSDGRCLGRGRTPGHFGLLRSIPQQRSWRRAEADPDHSLTRSGPSHGAHR